MFATSTRIRLVTMSAAVATVTCASADVVLLNNGGQVRGTLQSTDDAPTVVVETLLGGTVSIEQSAILDIQLRPPLVEDYESRARDIAHTVEARWSLAEWCKDNGLKEQRMEQSALLLDVDPNHAGARRVLGHVRRDGNWMTRDEWMTSRGYVEYGGKYITPREYQRQLYSDELRAAKSEWYPKVRQWFIWLSGNNAERVAEARANFEALTDPEAVPAIYHFFCGHSDTTVRLRGVELLEQFQGPVPVGPLVRLSIYDSDHDVRVAARAAIAADQHMRALEFYAPELGHGWNWVVRRTGVGIGELGDKEAVAELIEALITLHWIYRPILRDPGYASAKSKAMEGASHLPYGAIYVTGGYEPAPYIEYTCGCERKPLKNAEVLAALKKITGQDFGYDKRKWKDWWGVAEKYHQN